MFMLHPFLITTVAVGSTTKARVLMLAAVVFQVVGPVADAE
jgi:hypothetical protein